MLDSSLLEEKIKNLFIKTGKMLVKEKHEYMEAFLIQFFREWNQGAGAEQETSKKI